MDLIIRNSKLVNPDLPEFHALTIIDDAKSILWISKYYEVGTFEIYISVNSRSAAYLKPGYYVTQAEDENNQDLHKKNSVGIIEKIRTDETPDGEFYIVTGRMAESILSYRIAQSLTNLKGDIALSIHKLITDNFINPAVATRKIDIISIAADELILSDRNISDQIELGENILSYIQETLKAVNSAIKLGLDLETGKFKVYLWTGLDYSIDQKVNPQVIFSKEYDNLLSFSYEYDSSTIANAALVAGEEIEGESRPIGKYETPNLVSGLARREFFVDAKDSKKTVDYNEYTAALTAAGITWSVNDSKLSYGGGVTGTVIYDNDNVPTQIVLTDSVYNEILVNRGYDRVTRATELVEGEINLTNYKYKDDFYLGDLVTIFNDNLGIYTNCRIIEIQEVDDENGYQIVPIFEK